MTDRVYEDKCCRTPTFVGSVRNNVRARCAALSCRACVDLITCVAERYLTLRIGCERHGRKNPLPFPIFEAVTYRKSAPDYPRERGDSQEGGNRRCLPSCAPARRQRTFPRSAERNSPLNLSEKDCRPERANTLAQFVYPAQLVLKKAASRIGRSATRLVYPAQPMQGNWLTYPA